MTTSFAGGLTDCEPLKAVYLTNQPFISTTIDLMPYGPWSTGRLLLPVLSDRSLPLPTRQDTHAP